MRKGAFNLLEIRGLLKDSMKPKNIKDTSEELIDFIHYLSKFDPIFSSFSPTKRPKTIIDIKKLGKKGATQALINYFLESTNWLHNKPTWDVIKNPTEESIQSTGFQFSFLFKELGEYRFYLTGNISCPTSNFPRTLSIANFNQETDHTYPFQWYEKLLYRYVEFCEPKEASITSSKWTMMKVKTGVGRISYFSNDYDRFEIPKDLEGVEYKTTENGLYLYVCPEFIPEKEAFLACERKSEKVMNEIKSRVPEYSK